MEIRSPLRLYCKNCCAPMGFDIVRQTYACASCGSLSGIQETKETILHWRTLRKQNLAVNSAGITLEKYSCPACGAQIVFESGEASETCDFCGSRLIRAELTDEEQMPDMIIPFFITAKEARKRMLEWGHEHGKTPEGRAVVSSMSKFKGYYLPYQLARGPVYASITRDGSKRRYRCAGYLEGTAVSTSNQFDNSVLNGMEPFDWSGVRPFEYGYVAGQNIKLSNLAEKQIERMSMIIRFSMKRHREAERSLQPTLQENSVFSLCWVYKGKMRTAKEYLCLKRFGCWEVRAYS